MDLFFWSEFLVPEKLQNDKVLEVRLKDARGRVKSFKVKKTMKLGKVFRKYASWKQIELSTLHFFWKETEVPPSATAESLGMKNRDALICLRDGERLPVSRIRITDFRDFSDNYFWVKPTTDLSKAFRAYACINQVELSSLRFVFKDIQVPDAATPESLGMQNDDAIVCFRTDVY